MLAKKSDLQSRVLRNWPGSACKVRGNSLAQLARIWPINSVSRWTVRNLGSSCNLRDYVAEREGFEPPIGLHLCRISSAVHSTTLPPLQAPNRADRPVVGGVIGEECCPDKARMINRSPRVLRSVRISVALRTDAFVDASPQFARTLPRSRGRKRSKQSREKWDRHTREHVAVPCRLIAITDLRGAASPASRARRKRG